MVLLYILKLSTSTPESPCSSCSSDSVPKNVGSLASASIQDESGTECKRLDFKTAREAMEMWMTAGLRSRVAGLHAICPPNPIKHALEFIGLPKRKLLVADQFRTALQRSDSMGWFHLAGHKTPHLAQTARLAGCARLRAPTRTDPNNVESFADKADANP